MRRREFVAAAAALIVSSRRSLAQQARRRIGFLAVNELMPSWQSAWLGGLRNHGWVDGSNLTIEYRFARSADRLPALAAELIALNPELIMAGNPASAAALKSATSSIPIVFVGTADPVGIGFVQSLSRPGGNITGLATFVPGQFISKQVQFVRELVPNATRIMILSNPGNLIHRRVIAEELPQTSRQLGVTFPVVEATVAEEYDAAFVSAAAQHAEAIVVFADFTTLRNSTRITTLAAKHRIPAIYLGRNYAVDGGLISYGPDFPDMWLRAGGYVDKILKGTAPSGLPVEQPTKYELVINMKTAKALGLTVPPALLASADEVIE
ncbi:ABC transporter substrate-binding protein [Bradyrhizobium sp. 1(2017)]|uniref:ABC transporter substrate-binding protein n=1 Tax=Bradyrhizobium sp. 1(2017) TaxID=1404888 RepID=UPI00140F4470|nr:ABC transporter substrate-binding protein [Bradyrhizobium sp. 1(2017)]QIO36694.1 ABC transporter substrate-binding protein [Bradyrhizobium sp. 1(2017)]